MQRANGTAARRPRGAGDLILVGATIAFAIGLAAVAAGLDLLGAAPVSTPATVESAAPRAQNVRAISPASLPPAFTLTAPHRTRGWKGPAGAPRTIENREGPRAEGQSDPRLDLMEMGTANRQRGVTRHQAAIGHAYAP